MINLMVGLFIILFIIYRFLILERLPYQINENVSWWTICIVMVILLTQFIIFFNYIRLLYNKKASKITQILTRLIEYCYYKPLRKIGKYILKRKLVSQAMFDSAGALLYMVCTNISVYVINIIYIIIPRLLLAFTLLADIIIINKIHSFYIIIWIGIISLGYQARIALIKMEITQCKTIIEKNNINVEMIEQQPTLTPKNNENIVTFTYYVRYWVYCADTLDTITACYLSEKNKYYILLKILITTLFIIAWSFYLYYVLHTKHSTMSTNNFLLLWLIDAHFDLLRIYWR